jgi:hypothetical protein
LSAIVIHELRWKTVLNDLVDFRRELRDLKGLKLREEIHCTALVNKPGKMARIKRHERIDIIKRSIKWLNGKPDLNIFSVAVDKTERTDDVFEAAWSALLMRYENTIHSGIFAGCPQNWEDTGIIIPDNTDGVKLRALIRRMRHFNYVPNMRSKFINGSRNLKLEYLIEDPILRESQHSFMHQMNDVVAYCLRQYYEPNSYMKKKSACGLYQQLNNVLVRAVSRQGTGIVEL